jgi:hypothetical protein
VIPFLGGCRLAETDRTVARNYITVLDEEGRSTNTIRQAKVVLCAMFGMAVADGYVDYNPFHDVKIPKVPARRAIKVATPEQYLTVRACLPNKPAQVFSTLLVSSGIRFCEAIGLRPDDFDFEAGILRVSAALGAVWSITHDLEATWMGGGAVDGIAVVETIAENALNEHLALDALSLHLRDQPIPGHGRPGRRILQDRVTIAVG